VLLPDRRPPRGKEPTNRTRHSDLPRRHGAEDTDPPEPPPQRRCRRTERGQQIPPRATQRARHPHIHTGTNSDLHQEHPRRFQTPRQPAQPAAHRRLRHPQPLPDRAMTRAAGAGRHRRTDHVDGIPAAQQHRHRKQHMRKKASRAARTPRPKHLRDAVHPAGTRPPPRSQRLLTPRTRELATGQPRLDQNRISLYRHQRCLRASARPSRCGPPRHNRREGRCRIHPRDSSGARHSDDADHHPKQHNEDQHITGNTTDADQPAHQRSE
jgi:hypothetical protein